MAAAIQPARVHNPDVLIAGAGVIGLSLALELSRQGACVTVVERSAAVGGASGAAAGMLAAEDPHNPPELLALARYSLSLYPMFLANLEALSGQSVPFQTSTTVQHTGTGVKRLDEHSLDPRQLVPALLAAVRAAAIPVIEHTSVTARTLLPRTIEVHTSSGECFRAAHFVHTTGAWNLLRAAGALAPRKGQMLRVAMPAHALLHEVHRAEHVYVVPRTTGPQAGSALIGATVEDAGFDLSTDPAALQQLRAHASELNTATAFAADAPLLEAWAGLRPCTPDRLPLLGRVGAPDSHEWIASGHFRNGILLAPGTAVALSALLAGRSPEVDLSLFAPARFLDSSERTAVPIFDQSP